MFDPQKKDAKVDGSYSHQGLLYINMTLVSNLKEEKTELTEALDTSRYEAGRLFADAQAQLKAGDYLKAKESLSTLFANQSGSEEAAEGKKLMPIIEKAEKEATAKWEAAAPRIKEEWTAELASTLRAETEAERVELEKNMEATVNMAWEKEKDTIRKEWEQNS